MSRNLLLSTAVRRRAAATVAAAVVAGGLVPLVAAPAVAVAPTTAPALLAPSEGSTVAGDPVLRWSPVPGAVKYRVQVSDNPTFPTPYKWSADTANLAATPPVALPVGTVFWRVAGTDGANAGPFTVGSFERTWTSAPTTVAPVDRDELEYPDEPLLFRWLPLTGAKRYEIEIDDEPAFVSPVKHTTNNTSFTLTDPQPSGQQLYWRVRGVSGTATSPVSSPYSPTSWLTVNWPDVPLLTSPVTGQTVEDVEFVWSPVQGATKYRLEVSPNADFQNNLTFATETLGTRYSPQPTINNGSYYWRVQAIDPDGGRSAWSAQEYFIRGWNDAPTLIEPADGAFSVTAPTLRWTPVDHASYYRIDFSADPNFTTFLSCGTTNTSYTPHTIASVLGTETPVLPPGLCGIDEKRPATNAATYWRVSAVDDTKGIVGVPSTSRSFSFRHVDLPYPVEPADGATVTTPTLSWTPVLGTSRYVVHLRKVGAAVEVAGFPLTTYATSTTVDAVLEADATYQWWVTSLDDVNRNGLAPNELSVRSFTYAVPTETGATITLLSPDHAAESPVMPKMTWTPVTGAKYYKVWWSAVGSGVEQAFANASGTHYQLEHAGFTYPLLPLNAGTYTWRVSAYDQNGVLLTSSGSGRTFTVTDLDFATPLSPTSCTPSTPCKTIGETPMLKWAPVAFAGGYRVRLASDANFTTMVREYRTNFTSLTPRESLKDSSAGQAYYWYVQPCRHVFPALTSCGRFDPETYSRAFSFRKQTLPVELLAPADGAVVPPSGSPTTADVTFRWRDYFETNSAAVPPTEQGARNYQILVAKTDQFEATNMVDAAIVDQTTYTPWAKTYPEGPLYWKVQAIDGSGNLLTFSPVRRVEKATPPLTALHPLPGSTQPIAPYFQWSPQPGTSKYELEVYRNGDTNFLPGNRAFATVVTKLSAYTPTTSLAAGSYAWRVRRIDGGMLPGSWTSGGLFTVAQGATTLTAPNDGATPSGELLLQWAPVSGAGGYQVEISSSASFSSTLESVKTDATTWAPVAKLPDGTVYWRVKVLDAADNVMSVSGARTLVLDAVRPTVTVVPAAGGSITGPFGVTFSEPVSNVTTSTYRFVIAGTATGVPGTVTRPTSTTALFYPSSPLVPGESYTGTLTEAIVDGRNNPLVAKSFTFRTSTTVDQTSPALREVWDRDTTSAAYGGGFFTTSTANTKLSFTFTGTSTAVVGRRARNGGYAKVYLDGVLQGTVSFYASADQWRVNVWAKSGLANTKHRVDVVTQGTRPSVSSGTAVFVDGFRYGSSFADETHSAVRAYFRPLGHSAAYGRSYSTEAFSAVGDNGTKPFAELRFKGTRLVWRAFRAPSHGTALVYVDNVYRGSVDLYGSSVSGPTTVWSSPVLSNAQHTVRIYVNGTRRSGATGYWVNFDSFVVS